MTAAAFRRLALAFPGAVEAQHHGHPDFRAGGKIFATLGPGEEWGMVKLTVEQQAELMAAAPAVFSAIPGGWGRKGATRVELGAATAATLRPALRAAWENVTKGGGRKPSLPPRPGGPPRR